MVDFVQLKNGQIIGISDECIVLYPTLDAFYEGVDGEYNFPMIRFPEDAS